MGLRRIALLYWAAPVRPGRVIGLGVRLANAPVQDILQEMIRYGRLVIFQLFAYLLVKRICVHNDFFLAPQFFVSAGFALLRVGSAKYFPEYQVFGQFLYG